MFGYITIAPDGLEESAKKRYRAYYCGLCRTLRLRRGGLSRMTLSFDMTFLYILLSALYEPESTEGKERCAPHMLRPHNYIENPYAAYCADMNVALFYYKMRDDWQDEKSHGARLASAMLEKQYRQVRAQYPEKCAFLENTLEKIRQVEAEGKPEPDLLAELSGQMLGCVFDHGGEAWSQSLKNIGMWMGRFIYLMDAWDDLEADRKKGSYNPLAALSRQDNYGEMCLDTLKWTMAQCAREFEFLPILQDVDILRNILYAGCWTRYRMKTTKEDKKHKQHKQQGRTDQ